MMAYKPDSCAAGLRCWLEKQPRVLIHAVIIIEQQRRRRFLVVHFVVDVEVALLTVAFDATIEDAALDGAHVPADDRPVEENALAHKGISR